MIYVIAHISFLEFRGEDDAAEYVRRHPGVFARRMANILDSQPYGDPEKSEGAAGFRAQ